MEIADELGYLDIPDGLLVSLGETKNLDDDEIVCLAFRNCLNGRRDPALGLGERCVRQRGPKLHRFGIAEDRVHGRHVARFEGA